jgi:hypothetical protein
MIYFSPISIVSGAISSKERMLIFIKQSSLRIASLNKTSLLICIGIISSIPKLCVFINIPALNVISYNNVLHYNTGKLINYWNVLCIYYKVNVLKTYKPLLDSQIVGEPTEKVRVIRNVAIDSDYIDKNEISTLYNYMVATNYEPIRHILYSSNRNNVGELTPYEETLLDPSDPRHRQVIRSRNIPLGRPQKIPQSVKVSIDPVTGKQVRTMPKRTYTKKNKKTDTETETEEEQQPYEIDMSEDPVPPVTVPASASATPKKPIKLKTQKP